MNLDNEAIQIMASSIKDVTKKMIDDANYDTTIIGTVTQVLGSTYSVRINGETYTMKSAISGIYKGQNVRVSIPCGNWNNKYISATVEEQAIKASTVEGLDSISNLEIDGLF